MTPVKTWCAICGEDIFCDSTAMEIRWDKWVSELKPFTNCTLMCRKCFVKHLMALVGTEKPDFVV